VSTSCQNVALRNVPALSTARGDPLGGRRLDEASDAVRARVEAAREKQRKRFAGTDIACNADMRPADVRKYCKLDEAGNALIRTAMTQL
jgi:magnesium chelatase family protein